LDIIESEIDILNSCCDTQDSRLDIIESEIDLLESCCDAQDSRLDIVDSEVDILESCCDALNSRVNVLESIVDTIETQDSRFDVIESQIELLESCCDAQDSRLDVIDTEIDILESCCDVQDSRLDILESEVDLLESCCDAQDSRLDIIDSEIDSLESCCDALNSRVDVLESIVDTIEAQDSRFDVIESQIDLLESCCDAQDSRLDIIESEIDSLDSRLDIFLTNELVFVSGAMDRRGSANPTTTFSNVYGTGNVNPVLRNWLMGPSTSGTPLQPMGIQFAIPRDFDSTGSVEVDVHVLIDDNSEPADQTASIRLRANFIHNNQQLGISAGGFPEDTQSADFTIVEPTLLNALNHQLVTITMTDSVVDTIEPQDWANIAINRAAPTVGTEYASNIYLSSVTFRYKRK